MTSTSIPETVERSNITRQVSTLMPEALEVMTEVLASGRYILGERGRLFEEAFAAYVGAEHAVGVASGTEALYLALKEIGLEPGDEVITTPFTAVPTISAIVMAGGTPVFADIDPRTYTIDPEKVSGAITPRTKAIIPVHLYGQSVVMEAIVATAQERGLIVIEDAAQAHGSYRHGNHVGSLGDFGCFSFYPTKNLGAYGDAGLIVCRDAGRAQRLRLLRNYGQTSPYETVINGINSRLDELQAAVLTLKLRYLEGWNERRREVARQYREMLTIDEITHPIIDPANVSNFHVYVLRAERRDELWRYLESNGVQSNVYYPVPAHLQPSNRYLNYRQGDFPEAERASREVLAIPMFPELRRDEVERVVATIKSFYGHAG